jgi:hypothetical protein
MKKIIRLTESDLTRIVKKIVLEQSEHVKNLYKSWANKKSGNPERALSIMDDVLKLQKQLPKKDFANYTSYEELLNDLNKIKQTSKSEDVTKIYEDKDLLVMAANTWESSCKYGAGSKWCTTAKDDNSYWRRHNETGTEFFWIFKNKPQNDPNHKFSYHVKINGEPDWCNAVNNCMSTTRLPEESYPKKHPRYSEIIKKLQEIHDARGLKELENQKSRQSEQIVGWVETNLQEISNEILKWNLIDEFIEEAINDFIEFGMDTVIPMSLELDDEEGIEKFQLALEDEIYNNFNRTLDGGLGYSFISSLAWLIEQHIEDPIEYLTNHTPKELLDELYDINGDGLSEIISEEMDFYLQEEIHNFASRFAFDYRP